MARGCERVQARLDDLVDDRLAWPRRRLLERHLRHCEECAAELERQRAVATGLDELGAEVAATQPTPPDDLLDALLERAEHAGVRARAAVPVRGAVSGARPGLSVVGLVLVTVVLAAAVYTAWRGLRAAEDRWPTRAPDQAP